MTPAARWLAVAAMLAAGCDGATRPPGFVIPGPTVPSPIPTTAPYVWDTREELAVWMNEVTKGSVTLEGNGSAAYLRISQPDLEWVLRGPDLAPSATGVRTLRLRYRWIPDASLPATAARTLVAWAFFQTTSPLQPFYFGQATASAELQPQADWFEISFNPSQYTPPIDVSYCYMRSSGSNRGRLDIDWISLITNH